MDERFLQKGRQLSVQFSYLECNKTVEKAFLHVNGLGVWFREAETAKDITSVSM